MLNQLIFTFGQVPPKKNNRKFRKGKNVGGYTVPSDAFDIWHSEMTCEYSRHVRLLRSPVSITARYWAGSFDVMDMSNAEESIHDFLRDIGAITDDCITDLQAYSCEFVGLRKGLPKVEVTVTELEWTPAQQAMHLLRSKEAMRAHVAGLKAQGLKATQVGERARLWGELANFEEYNERYAEK